MLIQARLTIVSAMIAAILAVFTAAGPAMAAARCPNAAVANKAGKAFLAAAKKKSAPMFAKALEKYADMEKISKFALGKHRRRYSDAQLRELVALSGNYISVTLADFARKFKGSAIFAIECRRDGIVKSRLEFLSRSAKAVLWRFNGSKITDVYIQNVWLAQLLRDNYASIIRKNRNNPEALLAHLRASQ
ncbi:MAG TPA: ABC transporter substrate-binding protein [Rhizobiales bacterium]|nr:ABC transporter substrate-binding protein [Hyphomicrobiales bacterium]